MTHLRSLLTAAVIVLAPLQPVLAGEIIYQQEVIHADHGASRVGLVTL